MRHRSMDNPVPRNLGHGNPRQMTVDVILEHLQASKADADLRKVSEMLSRKQRLQDQPTQIASFTTTPRVTLLPGGLPISVGGVLIGGIGVGGGTGDQDVLVAQAALSKVLGIV